MNTAFLQGGADTVSTCLPKYVQLFVCLGALILDTCMHTCVKHLCITSVWKSSSVHTTHCMYDTYPQMTGDPLQYLSLLELRVIPLLVHKDKCRSNEQLLNVRG